MQPVDQKIQTRGLQSCQRSSSTPTNQLQPGLLSDAELLSSLLHTNPANPQGLHHPDIDRVPDLHPAQAPPLASHILADLDKHARADEQQPGDQEEAGDGRRIEEELLEGTFEKVAGDHGGHRSHSHQETDPPEIGRASCRERV